MADLPDWYTLVSEVEAEAYSIRGGADVSKPSAPGAKDVYLATDTERLWYCVADGAWADYFINAGTFNDHSARHEDGGADEISIAGLAGEPAELTTHKALTTGVHGVGAGAIVGTTLAQTLTNKTLTSPDINGGTVDAITSLTVANDVDIGNYNLRAKTLQSDVATGAAPLTVASTTVVTNLNADLLDAKHYSDISTEIDTDVANHAALTTTHGVSGNIVGTSDTQTLTNKTLTSPTIQGTVSAGTSLTMPAFTLGGTLSLGGQTLDAGSDNTLITSSGNQKGIRARSTYAGVYGGIFETFHDSASPAANDYIGFFRCFARNSAAEETRYHSYYLRATSVTDGHETVKAVWDLINNGGYNNAMELTGAGELTILAGLVEGAANVAWSEPTRALDTVYRNTTGKIKVVSVSIVCDDGEMADLLLGSSSPPTTRVLSLSNQLGLSSVVLSGTIIVPDDYYYKVASSWGAPSKLEWHEWDLH